MDNESKGIGNSINYEFRTLDPRIGRFFSVDPLAAKYPFWTPYQFAGNQVISSKELEGLEPQVDLNAQANFKYTLGGKSGTSHFNLDFSAGASVRNSFGQIGLNVTGNLTNGGLGSPNGKKGDVLGLLTVSPSLTLGGGTTQTAAPLNTFQSGSLTSVSNNFSYSLTHAQNFAFSGNHSSQRVGAYGIKLGDVSLNVYNDTHSFMGDTEDRWWSGGGNLTISNFLGNSANTLTVGNDVFTGNSFNKESFADFDGNEPTYSYQNGVLHYAGQSQFDPPGMQGYNQSLNMGQTFLRLNSAAGIFQISHSGNWDMFSQNKIHDGQDFHRFLSTVPNQFNFTIGRPIQFKKN